MTALTAANSEKRKIRRYPAIELRTNVRRKRGLMGADWSEVTATDFSHQGICVDVDFDVSPGQLIVLSFDLKMEMGSITLDKVTGKICHVKSMGGLKRCGIQFQLEDEGSVKPQLVRIESLLARNKSVAERIQNQI